MSRILVAVCLVLAMASVGFADSTYLIQSWEDGSSHINSWGPTIVPNQTEGVTDGSYSVGIAGGQGWNFIGEFDIDWGSCQAMATAKYFEIDVTVIAAENPDNSGVSFGLQWQGDGINWSDMGGSGASWNPSMGDATMTYVADVSALASAKSWMQMFPYVNSNDTGYVIYLDNARWVSVPEPATMALLGLGGLALIRRKK